MAQLVARLVRNEKVGGSNPPSSTHEPPDQKADQGVSHDRGQKKSWKRNCSTQYGQPCGPSSSSPSFTHWLTSKVKSSGVAPEIGRASCRERGETTRSAACVDIKQ